MTRRRLDIALPANYRRQDALAFHGRDAQGLAERIEGERIRKGVLLDGVALALTIDLEVDKARCTIDADAADDGALHRVLPRAQAALHNMLGLRIDPAPFEATAAADPWFGPLVRRTPGLRVIQSASVFEALSWAIIGQQINLPFAIALRRSFIAQAGRAHPDGLWCYPEAADVARLDIEQLTSKKFSRAKAETLLRLARLIAEGELTLEADGEEELAAMSRRLLAIKGIGPWTVNYALLRGYGDADCSLHGDVAVRTAIGRLQGGARPDIAQAEAFLAAYSPQRTMAAAYLWDSLKLPAG